MDELNINHIRKLSDKMLVNMFSDTSADEMKRRYTFTCYMLPYECQESVSVYGNEEKGRARMRNHLKDHIFEIEMKSEKGKSPKTR